MKRGNWWLVLEAEAIATARLLHTQWDEDPADRISAIRGAYVREDYAALVDIRDSLELHSLKLLPDRAPSTSPHTASRPSV